MGRGPSKKKGSTRAAEAYGRVVWTCTALLGGAALLAGLEPYAWVGSVAAELNFHLALLSLAAAALAALLRMPSALAVLVALALFYVWPLWPLYRPTHFTPQTGPVLRVATADLAGATLDEAALRAWLARERPDAAVLTGLSGQASSLGPRLGGFRIARGSDDPATLLLVQSALLVSGRERASTQPTATVRAGRCQARIVGVSIPPIDEFEKQGARARTIATLAALPTAPRSVWLGQLGSRARAHDLHPFVTQHTLRDARLGHGRLATGPSELSALGFPRSHVLVQGWISVRALDVQPPLCRGAARTLHAVVELTEARCRFSREGDPELNALTRRSGNASEAR